MKIWRDMLKVEKVKEGKEFAVGRYDDRVVKFGLYLNSVEGTLMRRVESRAKKRFSSENDAENFTQEARYKCIEKIEEYVNKNGEPKTDNEVEAMEKWVFKAVDNYLIDLDRGMKGRVSVLDKETGEYNIVTLLSLDNNADNMGKTLQGEVENVTQLSKEKSFSEFRIWFNENKERILTKKQLAYIENPHIIDPKNTTRMNKTICERINKHYSESTIVRNRIEKINKVNDDVIFILNSVNDSQLLMRAVGVLDRNSWLEGELYSLSFATCKLLTKGKRKKSNEPIETIPECVQEIREKLNELNKHNKWLVSELSKKII